MVATGFEVFMCWNDWKLFLRKPSNGVGFVVQIGPIYIKFRFI